jgi:hypothetical protein
VSTLAGCGDGSRPAHDASSGASSSNGAHAGFIARVDKVCARAVAAHAGHSFPVADFDPEHPDPAQPPTVGNYFAEYGGLPKTDTALHALVPPASDADAWQTLLDLADQMTANAQRQIAAARARDVPGFVHTVTITNELAAKLNAAGTRFAFKQESACGQVFG